MRGNNLRDTILNSAHAPTPSICARAAAILFLMGWMLSGCAGPKVKVGNIEAAKGKLFRVGVVKAAGSTPITVLPFTDSRTDTKKKALEQINIDEICAKLKKYFAFQIDPAVDRTVRTVREPARGPASPPPGRAGVSVNLKLTAESAYYGNTRYDKTSLLWLMLGGSPALSEEAQVHDVIDVSYDMEPGKLGFETTFVYSVKVTSSGESVLEVNGAAATIRTPRYGPFIDHDALWEEYVKNAAHIDEALDHDLAEYAK